MVKSKTYYYLAWFLIFLGTIVTVWYLFLLKADGWSFWNVDKMNIERSGQFGDYIGGFVGTLFSLAGFIFLYLTLKEQRLAFRKERFENHFFELIKLHRENINELAYTKFDNGEMRTAKSRKVFREIFREFEESLIDVRHFLNSNEPDDYYIPKYKRTILEIFEANKLDVDLIGLATADIAYCIVFFGVSKEGDMVLRNLFQKKYKPEYFLHLLTFIRLKPKKENLEGYSNWEKLRKKEYRELKEALPKLYYYNKPGKNIVLSAEEANVYSNFSFKKYYGGHQHRLGHYFRHLFQSYKFLNSQSNLTKDEKYFYGKTLRAQLSTYEQALLFINSISCLGLRWELNPEIKDRDKKTPKQIEKETKESKMITNYNLIKNLPGRHIYGLYFRSFYPKVRYESDEI